MNRELHEYFPLDITLHQEEMDGITPLSKLNGTSVTIADVLLHDEKLLIGSATFTKKCQGTHCFVAKCAHEEFEEMRERSCKIFKNIHLTETMLDSLYSSGAIWL